MNADIECTVNNFSPCLGFHQMQQKEKIIHMILGKTWEVISVYLFTINSNNFLSVLDCQGKEGKKTKRHPRRSVTFGH